MTKRIALYLSGLYPGYYCQPNRLGIVMKIRKFDGTNFENDFVSLLKNSTDQDYFFSLLDTFKLQHPNEFESLLNELGVPSQVRNDPSIVSTVVEATHRDLKPIVFTEGKTDVAILKMAWLRLNDIDFDKDNFNQIFDKKCGFRIKSADLYDGEKPTELSNAEVLGNILYYWKGDTPVIGLFDRDDAGFKGLHCLNIQTKVFEESTDTDGDQIKIKNIQNNPYVVGFLYPIPLHRIEQGKLDNGKDNGAIELEYFFTDEDITHYIAGRGSIKTISDGTFSRSKITIKRKQTMIESVMTHKDVINFNNFQIIFDKINHYISFM